MGKETLEDVKEVRYLGFIVQKNGGGGRKTHKRKNEKGVEHWGNSILGRSQTKDETAGRVSMQSGFIRSGNMGVEQ